MTINNGNEDNLKSSMAYVRREREREREQTKKVSMRKNETEGP
jgi:hypothetical protein